jgi:hypothetical protein
MPRGAGVMRVAKRRLTDVLSDAERQRARDRAADGYVPRWEVTTPAQRITPVVPGDGRRHGRHGYRCGCRCATCRAAKAADNRRTTAARRAKRQERGQ